MKLLPKIFPATDAQRQAKLESDLIHFEAKLGGQLFGPLPKGHDRQFFCLDERTWIWYESWIENGVRKNVTTRYILQPNGVLKSQEDGRYTTLSAEELRNLLRSVELYQQKVTAAYTGVPQAA